MALFALQSQVFRLAGSGASISDTSITLVMMKGIEGNAITMAQLGSKAFATIEPGSGDKEEQISFTGITQNPNGTATLTGVKSVSFYTPYTETNGLNKSHSGGVALTLSNTSGFYNALFNSINKFNITCATTANVDIDTELENGDVVDGYTLATGDTVLVKNQTTQSENGVYIVNTSGAATRAGFFNDDLSIKGAILMVAKGTVNQGTIWRNTNATAITVGVTNITFDDYVKTVDNVGTGEGEIFRDKVGGTGNFKTIKQSGKITVTNNADDITIDTTAEINTASNVGTGEGTIFKQKTVEDLELKTIKAGTNITITNNADEIIISSTDTGEVNTASNVGAGSGIFKQKTGSDLEFKTLVAGPGVSLTNNTNDVTITFSPATAKATGSEIDTGTDNTKYVTSKAIADSKISFTDGVETLTNKTIDLDNNTILNAGNILIGENLLDNSNFINNSTNGYGFYVTDNWNFVYNTVQGGFPTFTKQQLMDGLGIADGVIEGLWNLQEVSGDAIDLSSNNITLTVFNDTTGRLDGPMIRSRDWRDTFWMYTSNVANIIPSASFTWDFVVKFDALTNTNLISFNQNSSTYTIHSLSLATDGKLTLSIAGLSNTLTSDVVVQTGKFYHITATYDSGVLSLWVNGIKKSIVVTGSINNTGVVNMGVGRNADTNVYLDGLLQNLIILSTGVNDQQAKKLWYMTTYKGMKLGSNIHDASDNSYVLQVLSDKQRNAIQGKTVTFAVKTFSTGTTPFSLGITLDNVALFSQSITPVANTWETHYLTATIPDKMSYANSQYLGINKSSDTLFVKEAMLYEGTSPVSFWNASQNDWQRFPRLMRMDPPADLNGGYHFEENRWYHYPVIDSGAINPVTNMAKYLFNGKKAEYQIVDYYATSNNTVHTLTLPFNSADYSFIGQPGNIIATQGAVKNLSFGTLGSNNNILTVSADLQFNPWTNSGVMGLHGAISVAID